MLRLKKGNNEYGKAFIYKLLGLLRETNKERINTDGTEISNKTISMAHWVYFLTRMESKVKNDEGGREKLEKFREFTGKLHSWIENKKDRHELEMALELYVYTIRNDKNDQNNSNNEEEE